MSSLPRLLNNFLEWPLLLPLLYCPRVCSHVNRRVPDVLDWQTWRRQLNYMSVDSIFTVKCVANVFASLKRALYSPLGVCLELRLSINRTRCIDL